MKKYHICSAKKETVQALLQQAGVHMRFPCGGQGKCGKCKITVTGDVLPPTKSEMALLSEDELNRGVRLACSALIEGDADIILPEKESVRILQDSRTQKQIVLDHEMSEDDYGIAVDIGTTTVVCALFDHIHRNPVDRISELNQQTEFGADVISRLMYCQGKGTETMHQLIVEQIRHMIQILCKANSIEPEQIRKAVVTGNTTMLHFFADYDSSGLGVAPFKPASLFDESMTGVIIKGDTYVPPCVSAYVGADIVCGVLSADYLQETDHYLLVDLGTNGEIVLRCKDHYYTCSTAAGPVFEGYGISCGTIARSGAIDDVLYDDQTETIICHTIGDEPANGICGSGLIAAIALLVRLGGVDQTGRLQTESDQLNSVITDHHDQLSLSLGDDLYISQKDIRQVQLAKAAIRAGIMTLIEAAGITNEEIDRLYIAGGFGSFLNIEAAETIGLLPSGMSEKTIVLGNSALNGASMLLLNSSFRKTVADLKDHVDYIELSGSMSFQEKYLSEMGFPS